MIVFSHCTGNGEITDKLQKKKEHGHAVCFTQKGLQEQRDVSGVKEGVLFSSLRTDGVILDMLMRKRTSSAFHMLSS